MILNLFLAFFLTASASELTLPPPPAPGSEAEARDFAILFRYQETRTEEECEVARRQAAYPTMKVFYKDAGILTEDEYDQVQFLGNKLILYAGMKTKPFKTKYNRLRPHEANSDIHPCVRLTKGKSYPSGHASAGLLTAEVFARIFPEKAEALIAHGTQIGKNRTLGGAHFPSDVEAGQSIARQLLKQLPEEEWFREAVEELEVD